MSFTTQIIPASSTSHLNQCIRVCRCSCLVLISLFLHPCTLRVCTMDGVSASTQGKRKRWVPVSHETVPVHLSRVQLYPKRKKTKESKHKPSREPKARKNNTIQGEGGSDQPKPGLTNDIQQRSAQARQATLPPAGLTVPDPTTSSNNDQELQHIYTLSSAPTTGVDEQYSSIAL
jgi:hypothetical protein